MNPIMPAFQKDTRGPQTEFFGNSKSRVSLKFFGKPGKAGRVCERFFAPHPREEVEKGLALSPSFFGELECGGEESFDVARPAWPLGGQVGVGGCSE